MTPDQTTALAAFISGESIQWLVHRLEEQHGLTLSADAIAGLHRALRPCVEPVVRQALEQEAATHA